MGNKKRKGDKMYREPDPQELQRDVKNFIFPRLPGETTIDEIEDLSCAIRNKILEHWDTLYKAGKL